MQIETEIRALPSAQDISKAPKKKSRETEREIKELGCEIPVFLSN